MENHGQNKKGLANYLIKDHGYVKVNVTVLIERAVEEEAVKTVLFNGKESYRHHNILASARQAIELESSDLKTECKQAINKVVIANPTPNTEQ